MGDILNQLAQLFLQSIPTIVFVFFLLVILVETVVPLCDNRFCVTTEHAYVHNGVGYPLGIRRIAVVFVESKFALVLLHFLHRCISCTSAGNELVP